MAHSLTIDVLPTWVCTCGERFVHLPEAALHLRREAGLGRETPPPPPLSTAVAHRGEPNPRTRGSDPAATPAGLQCPACGRSFRGKGGLAVHRYRTHAVQGHQEPVAVE